MQETGRKKRSEGYFRRVGDILSNLDNPNRQITTEQFETIIEEVDKKFGLSSSRNNSSYLISRVLEVYKGLITKVVVGVVPKKDKAPGRNKEIIEYKVSNDFNLYYITRVKTFFNAIVVGSPTDPKNKLYRDAVVAKAKEIKALNPSIEYSDAYDQALNLVPRIIKTNLCRLYSIAEIARANSSGIVDYEEIRAVFPDNTVTRNNIAEQLNKYKSFGITINHSVIEGDSTGDRRKWAIRVTSSPKKAMARIEEIAGICKITLPKLKQEEVSVPSSTQEPVVVENIETVQEETVFTSGNQLKVTDMDRLAFITAGLCLLSGKTVSPLQVVQTLRDSRYYKITAIKQDVMALVKQYPNYFSLAGTEYIKFNAEKWKELSMRFNPRYQNWTVTLVINSDLSLDTVRKYFPNTNQEGANVNVGSKIYVIETDRSILSQKKLAQLFAQLRDTDFPVGEPGLVKRMQEEREIDFRIATEYLMGKLSVNYGNDNDRTLCRIEEL